MKRVLVGFCVVVMASWTLPQTARAQASADSEYDRGKDALKAGDNAGAIEAFKAGLKLAGGDEGRRWQFILALALTYDRADQPGFAIETYQRFLDQTEAHGAVLSPKWRERRELVREDIKRLEKQVATTHGYVTVVTEPPGAQVLVDGEPGGADGDAVTPVGFYLTPGAYVVSVALEGHRGEEQSVTLDAGKIRPLRFTLASASATDLGPTPTPIVTPGATETEGVVTATTSTEAAAPIGPWVVIGSAGALALAAGITAGLGADARADWSAYTAGLPDNATGAQAAEVYPEWRRHQDTVRDFDTATGVLGGLAGAAAVGGLIWLLMGDDEPTETAPTLSLVPTQSGVSGHATWRF